MPSETTELIRTAYEAYARRAVGLVVDWDWLGVREVLECADRTGTGKRAPRV